MLGKRSVHFSDTKPKPSCKTDSMSTLTDICELYEDALSPAILTAYFQELRAIGIPKSEESFNMLSWSSAVLKEYMRFLIDAAIHAGSPVMRNVSLKALIQSICRIIANVVRVKEEYSMMCRMWPIIELTDALILIRSRCSDPVHVLLADIHIGSLKSLKFHPTVTLYNLV